MKLKYLPQLDGVRALAALMVMFFHFFQHVKASSGILALLKNLSIFGQTGVSLFFVLSGFLITRILIKTKQNENYFLNFYARRSLRIFPLYYLFLIIFYFVVPIIEKTTIAPFNQQIWFWIYLQNFAKTFHWDNYGPTHFWSLAVEEHFYLFWPLIVYFFPVKKIKIWIVLLILISILVRIILVNLNFDPFFFTFSRMGELTMGAQLAIMELEGKLISANAKKFLIFCVIMVVPTIGMWVAVSGTASDTMQVIKFLLIGFCCFGLIGMVLTIGQENFLNRIFRTGFLMFTGRISYGLYVYHPLVFALMEKHIPRYNTAIDFVLNFGATYLVAALSFYLFEIKFLHFKKWFEYRKTAVKAIA